jgi:cation diffusion facilitator family transporter
MPLARGTARDRNAQVRRVLIGLLLANLAVVAAKFVIGIGTGSLSVLGDAVHSSVDAMNNVLGLAIIAVAARAPDEDHPYGHAKFETLGALAIVMFLSVSGFEIVKGAVTRLLGGAVPLDVSPLQIGLLVGTLAVNAAVAGYEAKRGRELDSEILLADAAHTRADVFVTTGVVIGVLLSRSGFAWADPLVALGVAVVIVVLAYGIVRRSIPILVDEHAAPAEVIRTAAESVLGVGKAYDIRSRGSSHRRFAELTIAVERSATVEAAHRIADQVETTLRRELDIHEVVVHIEPC